MKKIIFLFIAGLLIATSCLKDKVVSNPPDNIISKDKMAEILVDMQIAESSLRLDGKYGDTLKMYSVMYYKNILENHHISMEDFNISHQYYLEHPKEYKDISEKMIEILGKLEAENM